MGLLTPRATSDLVLGTYLLASLLLGVVLAVWVVPFGGFDDPFHWFRAVQVADGHLLASHLGENDWGGRIDRRAYDFAIWFARDLTSASPVDRQQAIAYAATLDSQPAEAASISFPSTASFSPLAYLPSAAGIMLARLLRMGLLMQVYVGRLANLTAYLAMVGLAARLLPSGRLLLIAALTTPTALHVASSFSADPVNTALPTLLIAWTLRIRLDAACGFTRRDRALLLALTLTLGLLKPIYGVLALMLLLVAGARFADWRGRALFVGAGVVGCCAIGLGWNLAYPFVPGLYWKAGADPRAALQAVLADPVGTLEILLYSIRDAAGFWWLDSHGRFGGGPSPYHFFAPAWLSWLGLGGLLVLAVADGARPRQPGAAALCAILAAGYVGLLLLAFLIGFGPPGSAVILGLQGRYFHLPELLLVLGLMLTAPLGRSLYLLRVPALCLGLAVNASIVAYAATTYAPLWR